MQCASELAEREPDVRERIVAHDERLRAAVAANLQRAGEEGDFQGDPNVHARVLLTLVNGLQLEARKGVTRTEADALVDVALAMLKAARTG